MEDSDDMRDVWDGENEDDDVVNDDDGNVPEEFIPAATSIVAETFVTFEKSQNVIVFKNDTEIATASNMNYLQPAVKNYESVDSIIKPDILFQVTCAHKHPCKQKGLYNVLKLLKNPQNPRLYFVVQPDRFATFRYQRYQDSKRKTLKKTSYANVGRIQQFAMEIKLASE
ncbi:hypothetical protein THRCLA_23197 [Thraustotheca clavata]|uniref:Crinkler (CRN) family protein n=1 Tax=Thraustotheca clavata TaxID=74557 RepID=A0A1V9YAS2_9STRA|nr:hypothetical protein THRCLA_23197 [Thraustotheca clavata]